MLDKSAGYPLEIEEHAINPLAGGIARHGYQCGMIWGAEITGRRFNSVGEHADFIRQGGCAKIIEACTLKHVTAAADIYKERVLVQI